VWSSRIIAARARRGEGRRVTTAALGVDGGLGFVTPAAADVRGRFLAAVPGRA
jgi:hypothetical protein